MVSYRDLMSQWSLHGIDGVRIVLSEILTAVFSLIPSGATQIAALEVMD